ncbi:MAG: hypothetical protein ACTS2F_11540 [Thainema sp.]
MMASVSANNGNGHRATGESAAWLQLSVRQFFEQCNWDGRAIAPTASPVSDDATVSDTSLNLTLSVRQFFDEFPWEGKPAIAAPVLFDALEADDDIAESDITLEDITDLFG